MIDLVEEGENWTATTQQERKTMSTTQDTEGGFLVLLHSVIKINGKLPPCTPEGPPVPHTLWG